MRTLRSAAGILSLLAAAHSQGAERAPGIRVHVSAVEGAPPGMGESVREVKGVLLGGKIAARLVDATMAEADLVLVLSDRLVGVPPGYARGTAADDPRLRYNLAGALIDARRKPEPVFGRGVLWSHAAADLVKNVDALAREREHALLRRRADWPAVGFEFEPLTKELAREVGATDGEVVVTALAAAGPGSSAGLRVGDALLKLDGRKLGSAGDLARAIYAAPSGAALRLDVAQKGARRTVTLTLP